MHLRGLTGLIASLAGVVIAFALVAPAGAAPPGAATNLSFHSQVCHANGTVSGTLSWSPSGLGQQYVDLGLNAGFSNYSRGGPYSSSANIVSFTQLQPGATYYARVVTATASGSLVSDTAVVAARSCTGPSPALITAPTNLNATAIGGTTINVSWTPGANNVWYCVDTARSLSDLVNLTNTWRNHGCWTTNNALTISNLQCGTTYYWLVYTWNQTSNIKSQPSVVQTGACPPSISRPTNLSATLLTNGNVHFDWDAGTGNIWYCVDTAKSQHDLLNLTNTWRNHGCWTTATSLVVSGLDCGTQYYWLVYAWNHTTNTKSNVSSFQSHQCATGKLELAPIVDVDAFRTAGGNYRASIVAALPNGCHTYDSHRVERTGNTIHITVWNFVVPGPCTFIYTEYDLSVNLGSNFTSGQTYTVIVNNDEVDTFVAD